jgi:hypothetical protein
MTTIKPKKTKRKKRIILTLVVVFAIAAIALYKYKFIDAYYKNFQANSFNVGDTIFVKPRFLGISTVVEMFRLVKNTDGNYLFLRSNTEIVVDTLNKYKSNSLGRYMGYRIIPFHIIDKDAAKDTCGVFTFYQIIPNPKGIKKIIPKQITDEVSGYKFIDSNYYIFASTWGIIKK